MPEAKAEAAEEVMEEEQDPESDLELDMTGVIGRTTSSFLQVIPRVL